MCLWFQITGNRIYVRHKYLDNIHTKHLWVQETMESVLNVNTRQHSCKMSLGPRNHGICARDEYWTTCTHAKCLWVQETTGSVLDTKTGKPYLIQWLQNRGPSKEHVAKVTVQMLCTSINRTSDKHTHCIYTYWRGKWPFNCMQLKTTDLTEAVNKCLINVRKHTHTHKTTAVAQFRERERERERETETETETETEHKTKNVYSGYNTACQIFSMAALK